MEKITTIFERRKPDQKGRGPAYVVPEPLFDPDYLSTRARPTEKLDGTNVRLTVRSGVLVRVEARMNPAKSLKTAFNIHEPWYRDAWVYGQQEHHPADAYIIEAAVETMRAAQNIMPDGEWSAEAIGPKIQGNPLGLVAHEVRFFERLAIPLELCVPLVQDVPTYQGDEQAFYDELHEFLYNTKSALNPKVPIEGIVWHDIGGRFAGKIKRKDFPPLPEKQNHGVIEQPCSHPGWARIPQDQGGFICCRCRKNVRPEVTTRR